MTKLYESSKNYGSSSVSKTEGVGSTPTELATERVGIPWKVCFFITRNQIYFSLYAPSKKFVGVNYWFNWYFGEPVRMKKSYWSNELMVAW